MYRGKDLFPVLIAVCFHAAGQIYPPGGKLRYSLLEVVRTQSACKNIGTGDTA